MASARSLRPPRFVISHASKTFVDSNFISSTRRRFSLCLHCRLLQRPLQSPAKMSRRLRTMAAVTKQATMMKFVIVRVMLVAPVLACDGLCVRVDVPETHRLKWKVRLDLKGQQRRFLYLSFDLDSSRPTASSLGCSTRVPACGISFFSEGCEEEEEEAEEVRETDG